jgi:PPOX class probable F420-dependent enzyme
MPGYGLEGVVHRPLPWAWAEERLRASRNYFLSTVSAQGRPHCVPVWGVWLEGRFFFSTGRRSRKARNLARSPRCVVCSEDGQEAVVVEGEAEALTEGPLFGRFAEAYQAKYDYRPQPDSDLVFAVRPQVAFGFIASEEEFPATATRWRFARGTDAGTAGRGA